MPYRRRLLILAPLLLILGTSPASAASLDGSHFGLVWAVPFAGILLSIALGPLLAPHLWEQHLGKIAVGWGLATLVPLALVAGISATSASVLHVLLLEYLPFILLLTALYTIAGGIAVVGQVHGTPALNTALLATGTVLASIIGTTGASMVLIRPLIRANDDRRHNTHVVVFFILLVSNIGGALTPLGDPPLFLGFLRGVDFFWTTKALWQPTLLASSLLLAAFYVLDRYWFAEDAKRPPIPDPTPDKAVRIRGTVNFVLIAGVVAAIAMSGTWKPEIAYEIGGVHLELQDLVRDGALILLTLASLALSHRRDRAENDFTWTPILEVGKLFFAIFICIIPVTAALQAGRAGVFAPIFDLVSNADGSPNPAAFFWATGLLSSVLDNAPTYLVFFELAGGNPQQLMGPLSITLEAISIGAVFMGAMTYIGNAPNFMVYAIARGQGVRMPGFLGYIVWSATLLLPVFALVTILFLR